MRSRRWKSVPCNKHPGACRGFTLLEVIIALGIVSIGILSVSRAITGYTETTYTLEQRVLANWVAANRLETVRILDIKPVAGVSDGQQEMGGRSWYLQETTSTTADPLLFRVDILVFADKEKTDEVGQLTGYLLAKPEIITTGAFLPAAVGDRSQQDDEPKSSPAAQPKADVQ